MALELGDVRRFVQRPKENPDQPDNLCGLSELLDRHGILLSEVHRDPNINTTELPTPSGVLVIYWDQRVIVPPLKYLLHQ